MKEEMERAANAVDMAIYFLAIATAQADNPIAKLNLENTVETLEVERDWIRETVEQME